MTYKTTNSVIERFFYQTRGFGVDSSITFYNQGAIGSKNIRTIPRPDTKEN